MPQAYIVDALRSPTGKRKGGLAHVHAIDLGAHVLKALVERNQIPADEYDDVIFGCVDTIGSQAGDIARTSWLAAGLPLNVPGTTIDRQCGSSQQALHFAAQAVMSGTQDVIAVGGVQTMTQIPISSAMLAGQPLGFSDPFSGSKGWKARFGDQPVNQFYAAQRIADHWNISRQQMEAYALESHRRALDAIAGHRFVNEIVPCEGVWDDETPRHTSLAKMAELEPVSVEFPSITAAVSSQTCDASAALLVVSEAALKRYNLTPRARIHHLSVLGDDPIWHLTAPIAATRAALKKAGMSIGDIDLVEINEAFASVVMAWAKELDFDPAKTNANGGAIALGHPLGASGARLMTSLLNQLEQSGGRYGLQTMCEGGGQANVTIIERL
ncbi:MULTISPECIES: acetyl-CoA C-acetyltransferase [Pseudomonas]|jgi:acetyl-CoA C-acetyltransferase|uniref:Acetyl-CoA C-acetyltransferase n=1 Tax=Pseudomonas psychrophila TaxID=122355 RepID=A0A8I1FSJ2_9PSED|nr:MULTISPECIES: acetyl-CoA C-acetyltransferase [Pseudomonas]EPJ91320.1 acetyl-CoA acetyltransferase [Pseudomonas psychrophila]KOX65126.1 acetyl-CoA acetyltransferase [Pseudomonas psychrophila]MBJ2258229.1 acetyl-CoA C-acetyltransferase [Pseudomonas psychrophila]MDY7584862.1 acetyl-CoA C-acetyltransferase [Pseudomonas sp. CCI3.1]MEB0065909.1 acetyl-CoA C-acetyltransferase [Pseudomonas sp. CCI3.1]